MVQKQVNMTQELIRKHLRKMHTAVPGKVVKYYPERGMCDIQPVMQYKKPNGEWIEYPELKDVPVWWPQTFLQESTIIYPIKKDDEVLVLLMERPIDYWLFGQQTEQDLMFDLSEAICIPGLFAKPNRLGKVAQDEEAIIIQRKDTFIKVKEDDVIIDTQRDTVINVLRDVTVNAERDVTVNAERDVTVNADHDITINSHSEEELSEEEKGIITINSDKDIFVNAEHDITINSHSEEEREEEDKGVITIHSDKDIILDAERRIEMYARQFLVNGEEPAEPDPDNPPLSFDGDLTVNGTIKASGDVLANQVSLEKHTHTDSQGGNTTAPK